MYFLSGLSIILSFPIFNSYDTLVQALLLSGYVTAESLLTWSSMLPQPVTNFHSARGFKFKDNIDLLMHFAV